MIFMQGALNIEKECGMQNTNRNVVVTGCAGYIGGITCIELKKQNYNVFGIDRVFNSHLKDYYDEFCNADIIDYESFLLIKKVKPTAIIHCAGTNLVGPSMQYPEVYFDNNVFRTNKLLTFVKDICPKTKFIFSSSAAVYGKSNKELLKEYSAGFPISPYGETKLMVETILEWYRKIHKLNYTSLRYFNACGANADGLHGQMPEATHIFAQLFDAALNDKPFNLFGGNYPTKDGTCIRDYIHVTDVALAHIKCIEEELVGVYNIGTGKGTSNLDCIEAVEKELNVELVVNLELPRKGDAAVLVADVIAFLLRTQWAPERNINEIVKDLKTWYNSKTYKSLINSRQRSLDAQPAI